MSRQPSVCDTFGISRSALYRGIQSGLFPPPVKVGDRSSAWPDSEIELIARALIAGASPDEIRQLVTQILAARKELMRITTTLSP